MLAARHHSRALAWLYIPLPFFYYSHSIACVLHLETQTLWFASATCASAEKKKRNYSKLRYYFGAISSLNNISRNVDAVSGDMTKKGSCKQFEQIRRQKEQSTEHHTLQACFLIFQAFDAQCFFIMLFLDSAFGGGNRLL